MSDAHEAEAHTSPNLKARPALSRHPPFVDRPRYQGAPLVFWRWRGGGRRDSRRLDSWARPSRVWVRAEGGDRDRWRRWRACVGVEGWSRPAPCSASPFVSGVCSHAPKMRTSLMSRAHEVRVDRDVRLSLAATERDVHDGCDCALWTRTLKPDSETKTLAIQGRDGGSSRT